MGLTGIITPFTVQSNTAWKEIPFAFFTTIFLFLLINDQLLFFTQNSILSRLDGALFLLFFFLFLYYIFKQLKTDTTSIELHKKQLSTFKIIIFFILGLGGLIAGGKLVVNNAIKLATILNVSEKIIGLTIVSVGTSLPELATSILAAIKKNNDIAVGNIIGSNIFNILFVLGLSSMINPIEYNLKFNTDLYILIVGTLFLFLSMYTGERKKPDRWESSILFLFYTAYFIFLIFN